MFLIFIKLNYIFGTLPSRPQQQQGAFEATMRHKNVLYVKPSHFISLSDHHQLWQIECNDKWSNSFLSIEKNRRHFCVYHQKKKKTNKNVVIRKKNGQGKLSMRVKFPLETDHHSSIYIRLIKVRYKFCTTLTRHCASKHKLLVDLYQDLKAIYHVVFRRL